jgi:hypothetical protein
MMKTDPQMPPILLGLDELGRRSGAAPASAPGGTPPAAGNDASASQLGVPVDPRRRMRRLVVAGAIALGAVAGLAIALRHPAPDSEPAHAAAPATAAVMPAAAPVAHEPAAPVTAQASPNPTGAEDDAGEPTRTAANRNAGGKPTAVKASKPHHRSVRRKDPAKW